MCDKWDEGDSQRTRLQARLEEISVAPHVPGSLCELLYTAGETGILDNVNDAVKIWKIVELAKLLGDNCPQELRK